MIVDASSIVQVLVIKGLIQDMPKEDQTKVKRCAGYLRKFIRDKGEPGRAAFALVGAEMTAEGE